MKFDGQPHKDEEMYERLFGKLVASAEDEDDQGDSGSLQSQQKRSKLTLPTRTLASTKGRVTSSEEGEAGDDSRVESKASSNKISGNHSVDGSNAGSDTSSKEDRTLTKAERVSAREARSKRRQAKIDVDIKDVIPPADGKQGPVIPQGNAKKRQRGETEKDDVVKVKLLTGTLYLYRGQYRRVEFVRRV